MALNLKFDVSTAPTVVKVLLSVAPAVVISALAVFLLILPKHEEIKKLNGQITKQENEIAIDQVKAAKLSMLKTENERKKKKLDELKLQLPEEKEVSGLLKQVSDLSIRAGLRIISWKPEQKRDHPSGTIYEIPVAVELSGSYNNLGVFYSSLTKLNRIVNISDIKISDPKLQRDEAIDRITFNATTFSAMSEKEMADKAGATGGKGGKK
ncbi:MAG TPA: type 4a pilus biogenesis protein PilO [Thermodesulfovibrionales bacterium]|nr:type 4a pilus biogenesis protein PilO [Thermodesulfovibrionales bacterium]